MKKMTGIELIVQELQKNQDKIPANESNNHIAMYLTCIPEQRFLFFPDISLPKEMEQAIHDMTRIHQLIKAGALIAAEIDRLQAIEGKEE